MYHREQIIPREPFPHLVRMWSNERRIRVIHIQGTNRQIQFKQGAAKQIHIDSPRTRLHEIGTLQGRLFRLR